MRLAGGLGALLAWVPLHCPLRVWTGLQCPTCGLGHALLSFAGGDPVAAWAHHPLGPTLWIGLTLLACAHACAPVGTAATLARCGRRLRAHPAASWVAVACYLGWGAMRG